MLGLLFLTPHPFPPYSYESFHGNQLEIVQGYPDNCQKELEKYDEEVVKFFGLSRKSPMDIEMGRREAEAATATAQAAAFAAESLGKGRMGHCLGHSDLSGHWSLNMWPFDAISSVSEDNAETAPPAPAPDVVSLASEGAEVTLEYIILETIATAKGNKCYVWLSYPISLRDTDTAHLGRLSTSGLSIIYIQSNQTFNHKCICPMANTRPWNLLYKRVIPSLLMCLSLLLP